MRPLVVVELEPGSDSFSSLTGRVVFVEIDLFPFETSPDAFGEDVIRSAPFSILGGSSLFPVIGDWLTPHHSGPS